MSLDLPSPLTILIIRHAEKPGEIWPGPGLTRAGKEDEKSLVILGWERAGAWAALFGTQLGAEKIAPAIAGEQKIEELPHKWDEARYDVVLRFDRISPEAPWSFSQLCPCLMSGDSAALLDSTALPM